MTQQDVKSNRKVLLEKHQVMTPMMNRRNKGTETHEVHINLSELYTQILGHNQDPEGKEEYEEIIPTLIHLADKCKELAELKPDPAPFKADAEGRGNAGKHFRNTLKLFDIQEEVETLVHALIAQFLLKIGRDYEQPTNLPDESFKLADNLISKLKDAIVNKKEFSLKGFVSESKNRLNRVWCV